MIIQDEALGRIEVRDIPLPDGMEDLSGTYTYSGRVLVTYRTASDPEDKDWYNLATLQDDGTDLRKVFSGRIPQQKGANGIRFMCFADGRRILLGDYVLECEPDIDHCVKAELVRLRYPEQLMDDPKVFCHWSEIIIAPDNEHMCWTTLNFDGAVNYLGRLVRRKDAYTLQDVCIVSSTEVFSPDPDHEGCVIPLSVRGGEVKQFIRGGMALTMVGNGDSITESVVQPLDSMEVLQITHTPGYEETTIFSPDETLGVVMSPRFSEKTNCAVFGLVPQPHCLSVRGKLINILYMYCVAGVRAFRKGNVGPALIEIEKSMKGQGYRGVDLSDPEGRWVYYSPMSWHPDSTRAMWNERTRPADGPQKCRLRMCRLMDRKASEPVGAVGTPDGDRIPYAQPLDLPGKQDFTGNGSIKIMGRANGSVVNSCRGGEVQTCEAVYDHFSDDGKTFYQGRLSVTSPASMFAPGRTELEADLTVSGEHQGEMKLHAVFERKTADAPAMLSFRTGEDGLPESRGYSSYDGVTLRVEDMEA